MLTQYFPETKEIKLRLESILEEELKRRGIKRNIILARTYLKGFYGSLGYKPFGKIEKHDGFVEKGIFHQKMEKLLG